LDELKITYGTDRFPPPQKKAAVSSPAVENEIEISLNDAIVDRRQIRLLPENTASGRASGAEKGSPR